MSYAMARIVTEFIYNTFRDNAKVKDVITTQPCALFDGAGGEEWCTAIFLNAPLGPSEAMSPSINGVRIFPILVKSSVATATASPA